MGDALLWYGHTTVCDQHIRDMDVLFIMWSDLTKLLINITKLEEKTVLGLKGKDLRYLS